MLRKSQIARYLLATMLLLTACMKEKPESLPENLEWNPELAFPLGTDRFGMNSESGFDTTLLEIDSLTQLPIWVDRVEIVMRGTVDFDLSSLSEETENISRLLFRVNIYNDFPHEALAQAYFRIPGQGIIDSLFNSGPLPVPAGTVNSKGDVIKRGYIQEDAIIEHERIPALTEAREIYLEAKIIEPLVDTSIVEAYPGFELLLDMGVMTRLSYLF